MPSPAESLPPPAALIRVAAPHPALAAYIRSYVGIEQLTAEVAHVGALPSVVLMVTWGGRVEVLAGPPDPHAGRALPLVAASGPFTSAHQVQIEAGSRGFHVRFSPTGARALLGGRPAPDEWADGVPASVERWAEAVAEAPSFEARVALADAFWQRRLPGSEVWSNAAVGLVTRAGGTVPIASLSSALGVSVRTLRRRFADDVGLTAKTFAQIERYRQAHGYLLRTPGASWRDVCERYGYADQAHFIRAFRRFTGETPTAWRAESHGLDLGMGLRGDGAGETRAADGH